MTGWHVEQDLDQALKAEFFIIRETPQPSGFYTFLAKSKLDGTNVEIKTVPRFLFNGGMPVSESDLAARRIQHPNIVPLIAAGQHGETFFWMSPEIDGRTLRARLSRGGRMHLRDSLIVLRDVSAALTHAHGHGIVHGGLSPDSILISGGSALVTDVGIPEVFRALRRPRTYMTPSETELVRYASPEQANGGQADTRSDAYAWGVIAYELLSGRHPFSGRSAPRDMLIAHSDETPAALANDAKVPAAIERLVMRCLSKNPADRPEAAHEILDVMTREMLVPPPAPTAGTGQKVVMVLLALAIVMIGVIIVVGIE